MRHLIQSILWRRLLPRRNKATSGHAVRMAPLRTRHPVLWKARLGFLPVAVAATLGWPLLSQQAVELSQTLRWRAIELSAEAGFIVRDVLVKGCSETTCTAVLATLGIEYGQALITFDPEIARRRLKTISWVKSAAIERHLNGVLHIHITERRPLALWQKEGHLVVVDEDGVILAHDELNRFVHLPYIVGTDAPRHTKELLSVMSSGPELQKRVVAAIRVSERRWDLQLDAGILVRLPTENQKQAWETLRKLEQRHKILARDVVVIDLRLPDRLVIQLSEEAMGKLRNRRKEGGRDT